MVECLMNELDQSDLNKNFEQHKNGLKEWKGRETYKEPRFCCLLLFKGPWMSKFKQEQGRWEAGVQELVQRSGRILRKPELEENNSRRRIMRVYYHQTVERLNQEMFCKWCIVVFISEIYEKEIIQFSSTNNLGKLAIKQKL